MLTSVGEEYKINGVISMSDSIKNRLISLEDKEYKAFHSRLMPNIPEERIIGIRIPVLRKLAKELIKEGCSDEFISVLPHYYYEENNLHAFILEEIRDFDKLIAELERFLPFVDNWATCDCLSPKAFRKNTDKLSSYALKWLEAEDEYTVRFGIETLMIYFLDDRFISDYPDAVASVKSDKYYINMMISWYFATALAKRWDDIIPFIENNKLDEWVHNKTIAKAIESYRITPEQKEKLRLMKRK